MSSASQWKRCFTNPDSWGKWNIFRDYSWAWSWLDLPSPHHICLSHMENKEKQGFPAKMLGQRKRQTLPERARDFSRDFIQLLSVPWGFSLSLVLKEKPQILHPNPGDTTRGHGKGKVAPTALWHTQVWAALACGKEIPLQISSPCKSFGNNLTIPMRTEPAHH